MAVWTRGIPGTSVPLAFHPSTSVFHPSTDKNRKKKNTHAQKPLGKESFLSVPFGSQGSPGKACANRGRGRAWVEPGFEDSLRGVLADIVKLLTSVSRQMFYIPPRLSLDNRTTGGRPLI